jgi:hypothetical protein
MAEFCPLYPGVERKQFRDGDDGVVLLCPRCGRGAKDFKPRGPRVMQYLKDDPSWGKYDAAVRPRDGRPPYEGQRK